MQFDLFKKLKFFLLVIPILSFFSFPVAAEVTDNQWFSKNHDIVKVNVHFYLSSSCPACQKADQFIKTLETKYDWLRVERLNLEEGRAVLEKFYFDLKEQEAYDFSVPALFFCQVRWTGFDNQENTGQLWEKALVYCHDQIAKEGKLAKGTVNVLTQWAKAKDVESGEGGALLTSDSIPLIALFDALNSCSFFCVWALLSFLWIRPNQKKQQYLTALVFLITLGLAHYFFQAHSSWRYFDNLFVRLLSLLTGLGLFLYSLSIYRKKKFRVPSPVSFSFLVLIPVTVFILFYQQLCPINIGIIFQHWISNQNYSPLRQWTLQLIYQIFYLFPLSVFLFIKFVRLRNKQEKGLLFPYLGLLILMGCGIILMLHPFLLSSLSISILFFLLALLSAWWLKRNRETSNE